MRTLALVSTVLVALTAPAIAGDDADREPDDDEPEIEPLPRTSMGFGFQAHGTWIRGRSESGFGPALEVALGRGRWQYVAEASVATSGMDERTTPALDEVSGRVLRGSLGLRWIARQFTPDSVGGIELFLLSALGMQRFDFDDDRVIRPEVALGFGLQVRKFEQPRLAFRLDVRAVFTPDDRMEHAGASTGFLTGITLAW